MKVLMSALLLMPVLALGQDLRNDMDRQWPLQLEQPAQAIQQLTLTPAVYAGIARLDASDLLLLDAAGAQVPANLLAAAAPPVAAQWRSLPWFVLPGSPAGQADDLSVLVQRDAQGRVTGVHNRIQAPAASATPTRWLVDASALADGARQIRLDWDRSSTALQLAVQVEGSDDLRQWRMLQPRAELVAVEQGDRQLAQMQLTLAGGARYLRLQPLDGGQLSALTAIQARLPDAASVPADLQWRELAAQSHTPDGWLFELDGRYPVSAVRVVVEGNSAVRWRLASREDERQAWQLRAGPWLSYQLDSTDSVAEPLLQAGVRDRQWRLQAESGAVVAAPRLMLGYRPEQLLWLLQGPAPYSLAAGSSRVQRAAAPVTDTLQVMRQRHGSHWQPGLARLGDEQVLAGQAALRPQRDRSTVVLWAVLLGGSLLVGAMGLSLLRRHRDSDAS
ncbi:hypothetical protein ABB30_13425 [Stenotrophomonas ginsengisoli]|uniref:DUF3999 domain-containing protein n=1 Tax=Stenotrophomonas ginsengisoli TaxID=336566 RepID=A0A0R0D998_9GAMM|nr:DUF3999 family protein [Stenotrophomonas ginsengisoli]KRG74730.1 hypothetical protein ABB30_13425 [Stenotrophomonas ginsengisoli]